MGSYELCKGLRKFENFDSAVMAKLANLYFTGAWRGITALIRYNP